MSIRPIVLETVAASDQVLVFSPKRISLSAKFVRENKLSDMGFVLFLQDDEDPYWLGFRFFPSNPPVGSLAVVKSSESATRGITATGLINRSSVLSAIAKTKDKSSRTFAIDRDKVNDCWFVRLRPSFERVALLKDKNSIAPGVRGIYRYFDIQNSLLYIGQGIIRDRIDSPERSTWGIHRIEYSILETEQDCLAWESHYLLEHVERFGVKPPLNRVMGHSQT
jgi:hypothetical protein